MVWSVGFLCVCLVLWFSWFGWLLLALLFVCSTQCKILFPFIRENTESLFLFHSFHMSSEPSLKQNVETLVVSFNIPQSQISRKVKFSIHG